MRESTGGYTVIEVMIFLSISAIVFISAQLVFQGQQNRTQFQQGMNDTASKLKQYVSQVSSGIFPGGDKYSCSTSGVTGRAQLSAGGSLGTNQACIFLGSTVQVVPGYGDLHVYTVLGNRAAASGQPATSLAEALPEPVVNNGANLTQTYSTPWAKISSSNVTYTTGAQATSHLVGFYNNLQDSYSTSGASGAESIMAKGYSFQSSGPASVNSAGAISCIEEKTANGYNCVNTPQIKSWRVCFAATGSNQKALLTINSTPAGVTTDISFTNCN